MVWMAMLNSVQLIVQFYVRIVSYAIIANPFLDIDQESKWWRYDIFLKQDRILHFLKMIQFNN